MLILLPFKMMKLTQINVIALFFGGMTLLTNLVKCMMHLQTLENL